MSIKNNRSEFDLIKSLKSKYSLTRVGDDCAVLPKDETTDLVVTADLLVENIDFRLQWTSPEYLGHKALAVSLSDIAAVGATASWAMITLGVPDHLWNGNFVDEFYEGWFGLASRFGVELVGGDISRSPEHLYIDSIVGGEVRKGKAILRSGAKPGDSMYVSGVLGGAAGGLKVFGNDVGTSENDLHLLMRQLKPEPQLILANLLQHKDIATSMIDISDGLSSDLGQICSESQVGAAIYADLLPVDPDLYAHFPADECFDMTLNGGEDFELLFTSPEKNFLLPETHPVTCIGEITANVGIIELIDGGKTTILQPKGYRHF